MKEFVLVSALCAGLSCEGGGSFRPLRKGDIYQPLQEGEGILPLQDGDSYRLLRNSEIDLPLQVGKTYRFQQSSLNNRPLQDLQSTPSLQDVQSAPSLQDIKSAPPLQDNPPLRDGESWLPLQKSNNDQSPPDGDTLRPRRDLIGGSNHHHPQDSSSNHANKDSSSHHANTHTDSSSSHPLRDVSSKLPLKNSDSDRPRRDSDTGGQFFRGQVALHRPGHTGGFSNSAPTLPSGGLIGSHGLGHGHLHLGARLQPAVAPPFTAPLGLSGGHTGHHGHLDSFTAPAVPALLGHTAIHGHGLGHIVAAASGTHSAALIRPAVAPAFSSYSAGLPVAHAGPPVHAAVAAPGVHSTHSAAPSYADDSLAKIIPYSYVYAVHDSLSGSNYDVSESDDGTGVRTGSYSVSLPDGRTQHVIYTADSGGYVATVTYEGTAVYPDL